jgi:hypothetical protein
MTLPPEIIDSMISSLSWMIDYFKWAHEQTELGGGYSEELQKAIALLDTLKKSKENV